MQLETLTLRSVEARPVLLKLERPIVARIATIIEWPLILIDLHTDEGIIGRSYLEPYIPRSMRYLVPALHDLGEFLNGRALAPIEIYEAGRKSLHFVGYQGLSMIAVAGLDMAAWDALSKASGLPLCVLLGRLGWFRPGLQQQWPLVEGTGRGGERGDDLTAEGGFKGLKLRLGRERPSDDLATIRAVRAAVGEDIQLMVDFNQGLHFGEALERCHAIDDLGLAWIEEPIVYDNLEGHARLAAELRTPIQIGENFYGPRDLYDALQKSLRLRHAGLHANWRRNRLATSRPDRGGGGHSRFHPPVSRGCSARHARHGDCTLVGVAELGRPYSAVAL